MTAQTRCSLSCSVIIVSISRPTSQSMHRHPHSGRLCCPDPSGWVHCTSHECQGCLVVERSAQLTAFGTRQGIRVLPTSWASVPCCDEHQTWSKQRQQHTPLHTDYFLLPGLVLTLGKEVLTSGSILPGLKSTPSSLCPVATAPCC